MTASGSVGLIEYLSAEGVEGNATSGGWPLVDRTVLLVDDHEIVRQGIHGIVARLFGQSGKLEILEASTLADASNQLSRRRADLDLVVLDLSLPDAGGVEVLRRLESDWSDLPVVVISATENWTLAVQFLKAGVLGFIPKSSNVDVMTSALRLVFSGARYFPDQVFFELAQESAEQSKESPVRGHNSDMAAQASIVGLSLRQKEVLGLILKGRSNKEIAKELQISLGTVKNHVAAILHAFNVNSRAKAALAAAQIGFQDIPESAF